VGAGRSSYFRGLRADKPAGSILGALGLLGTRRRPARLGAARLLEALPPRSGCSLGWGPACRSGRGRPAARVAGGGRPGGAASREAVCNPGRVSRCPPRCCAARLLATLRVRVSASARSGRSAGWSGALCRSTKRGTSTRNPCFAICQPRLVRSSHTTQRTYIRTCRNRTSGNV